MKIISFFLYVSLRIFISGKINFGLFVLIMTVIKELVISLKLLLLFFMSKILCLTLLRLHISLNLSPYGKMSL